MEKNSSLIEHAIILLPGLIIGYFLLIMNPPSDLLQYNDNLKMATTYHLSGSEIVNNLSSVFVFLSLFFFISTFLTFAIVRKAKEKRFSSTDIYLTIGSISMMGLIVMPYYGIILTVVMYSIGYIGATLALFIVKSYSHTRIGYLTFFCRIAIFSYSIIWAISDLEAFMSLGYLGLAGLFVLLIAYERGYGRKIKRKKRS